MNNKFAIPGFEGSTIFTPVRNKKGLVFFYEHVPTGQYCYIGNSLKKTPKQTIRLKSRSGEIICIGKFIAAMSKEDKAKFFKEFPNLNKAGVFLR